MQLAINKQCIEEIKNINTFVDGAAIQKAGARPYQILNECLKEVTLVPEGHICTIMMEMFNEQGSLLPPISGILVEPAGALAVGGLD
jgi:threonine dehydratase